MLAAFARDLFLQVLQLPNVVVSFQSLYGFGKPTWCLAYGVLHMPSLSSIAPSVKRAVSDLPPRLAVGFAGRCARRSFPLLTYRGDLSDDRLPIGEEAEANLAILRAEDFAAGLNQRDTNSEYRDKGDAIGTIAKDLAEMALGGIDRADFFAFHPRGISPNSTPEYRLTYHVICSMLGYEEMAVAAANAALAAAYYAAAAARKRSGDPKCAALAVDYAIKAIQYRLVHSRRGYARRGFRRIAKEFETAEHRLAEAVREDLRFLRGIKSRDTRGKVTNADFATHMRFEPDSRLFRALGFEATGRLDQKLIRHILTNPLVIRELAPRDFELLIADILKESGLRVSLTRQTRDGGYDIVAIEDAAGDTRYLIECKRYRNRKVGVQTVRALHGVVMDESAQKGVIVTTSSFSGPAAAYLRRNQWVLEGRDWPALLEWLKECDKIRTARLTRECITSSSE